MTKINKTADIVQYRKEYYKKHKTEISEEIECQICHEKLQKRSLYNHNKKFHETKEDAIDKIFETANKHNIKIVLDLSD